MISRIPPNLVTREVARISRLVMKSERRFFESKGKKFTDVFSAIETKAPRGARYQRTNPSTLNSFLSEANLPSEGKIADLGTGFGLPCFIFKLYFDKVFGYEGDDEIFMELKNIQPKLGPFYSSIEFRLGDFLKKDLSQFDILYFYRPFADQFTELMRDKLESLRKGTKVISYTIFGYPDEKKSIFLPDNFKEIPWDPFERGSIRIFERL